MGEPDSEGTQAELVALRRELAECRASLPAHSIRPHQVLRIEALEERIEELETDMDSDFNPS